MTFDKILIVANDSASGLKAAETGYDLARALSCKVALLHVIEGAQTAGNVDAGIFPDQMSAELKKEAEELLHQISRDYGRGVDTDFFIPSGQIEQTVTDFAREWDAKLIVAGSQHRKGLERLMMGSM